MDQHGISSLISSSREFAFRHRGFAETAINHPLLGSAVDLTRPSTPSASRSPASAPEPIAANDLSTRPVPSTATRSASRPTAIAGDELQSALLVILILLVSLALLNVGGEVHTLADYWRSFVDFLAGGVVEF